MLVNRPTISDQRARSLDKRPPIWRDMLVVIDDIYQRAFVSHSGAQRANRWGLVSCDRVPPYKDQSVDALNVSPMKAWDEAALLKSLSAIKGTQWRFYSVFRLEMDTIRAMTTLSSLDTTSDGPGESWRNLQQHFGASREVVAFQLGIAVQNSLLGLYGPLMKIPDYAYIEKRAKVTQDECIALDDSLFPKLVRSLYSSQPEDAIRTFSPISRFGIDLTAEKEKRSPQWGKPGFSIGIREGTLYASLDDPSSIPSSLNGEELKCPFLLSNIYDTSGQQVRTIHAAHRRKQELFKSIYS